MLYWIYCFFQDPAIGTSKRIGDASYESYDRGTAKNAWVTESDGKTPLLGEVSYIYPLDDQGIYIQLNISLL